VRLLKHEHSYSTIGGGKSNTAMGRYYPQGLFVCALCGCVLMGGPLPLSGHCPSAHLLTHVLSASHPRLQTGAHVRFYLLRLPPCARLLKHEHSYSTVGGGNFNSATA
jgi:hypothetical protein